MPISSLEIQKLYYGVVQPTMGVHVYDPVEGLFWRTDQVLCLLTPDGDCRNWSDSIWDQLRLLVANRIENVKLEQSV